MTHLPKVELRKVERITILANKTGREMEVTIPFIAEM